MIIKVLGTGAETTKQPKPYLGKYKPSCLITTAKGTILIDVGKDIFDKLSKEEILNIDSVLLTHGHQDAIGGIALLNKFLDEHDKFVEVYANDQTISIIKHKWKKNHLSNYNFNVLSSRKKYNINGITVKPIKVFHDKHYPTFAYNFENVFFYSSDMGPIFDEYEIKYMSNQILAIFDGAYWDNQIALNNHIAVLEYLSYILSLNNKYTYFIGMGNQWPSFDKANAILKQKLKEYKEKNPECKVVECRALREGEKFRIDLNKILPVDERLILKPALTDIVKNPSIIRNIDNKELAMVHLRCHQLWGIKKSKLVLKAHVIIVKEFFRRKMNHHIVNDLDRKTYRILGREIKAFEIWNELKDEIVIKSNIVKFVGSSLKDSNPNDLDVIAPHALEKILHQFIEKYNPHFIGDIVSHGDVVNVYDLILKKKKNLIILNRLLPDYTKQYNLSKIISKLDLSHEMYIVEPVINGKAEIVVDKESRIIYEHIITDNKEIITDLLAIGRDNLFNEILANRIFFLHKKWLDKSEPKYLPLRWFVNKKSLLSFLKSLRHKYSKVMIRPANSKYYDGKFVISFKSFVCECLDCGFIMESSKHCREIKCPRCGGEMRRASRPGIGKSATLAPFSKFPPLKATGSAYHELEYFNPEDAWNFFGKYEVSQHGKVRFEYKIDGWRCLHGEDEIITIDKLTKVQHIKEGDLVLTGDGTYQPVKKVLSRYFDKDRDEIYEIKVFGGISFKVTQDHLLLTNRGWIRADQLKSNDYIFVPYPKIEVPIPEFLKDKELKLTWRDVGYTKKIKLTPEFWRFVGHWVGDGMGNYVTGNKHYTHSVALAKGNKDQDLIREYTRIIKEVIKAKPHISKWSSITSVYCLDEPLLKWLTQHFKTKYNSIQKSKSYYHKTIPLWLVHLDNESFEAFLTGYAEADGTKRQLPISTESRAIASRLYQLLLARKTPASCKKWKVQRDGKRFIYYRISLITRHIKKSDKGVYYQVKSVRKLQYSDQSLHALKYKVTKLYDLVLDTPHSFVGPGVTYHNCILQAKENKDTLIYFEDSKTNRSDHFSRLVSELNSLHSSGIILDGELMEKGEDGKWKSRHDLMKWSQSKHPGSDENVRVFVFDILYYNGKDLHNLPFSERRKVLLEVSKKFKKHFILAPGFDITSKQQLISKFNSLKNKPGAYHLYGKNGIDGLMGKSYSGNYPLTGKTNSWIKLKYSYEVDTIILEKFSAGQGAYNYKVGYSIPQDKVDKFTPVIELNGKYYGVLGKTFNTKINGSVGQILNIAATEYKKEVVGDKTKYTLFQARVITLKPDKKEPDSYLVIDRMSVSKASSFYEFFIIKETPKTGQWTIEEGMTGRYAIQCHSRGIRPELVDYLQTTDLKAYGLNPAYFVPTDKELSVLESIVPGDWKRAIAKAAAKNESSKELTKLISTLLRSDKFKQLSPKMKSVVARLDPVSIHQDLRLVPSGKDYFEGGHWTTPGNQFKENKLLKIEDHIYLQFMLKQPHVGESASTKEPVVRGPASWLSVGAGKPLIVPPNSIGSTSKEYACFWRHDIGSWYAGRQTSPHGKHFKLFKFKGGKLNGWIIFMWAPVGGKRIWLCYKPRHQDKYERERERNKQFDTDVERLYGVFYKFLINSNIY